jgi:hypothetical protein
VVVHADSNLLGDVTTRVVSGTLMIGTAGNFTAHSPMSVDVSVPALTALHLSGSGLMSVTGIKAPALTVTLSGSGILTATGTATKLDVTLDGSGKAQLNQLTASDAHAALPGSGVIQVTATTSLDAAIPGSSVIFYGGNPPQVNQRDRQRSCHARVSGDKRPGVGRATAQIQPRASEPGPGRLGGHGAVLLPHAPWHDPP